jgi:hypothetical protein
MSPGDQNNQEAGGGRADDVNTSGPTASSALDVFLFPMPAGSAAASGRSSPSPIKVPPPFVATGVQPRSPAPGSTNGGKKRSRGRQPHPGRSHRHRSGSEGWTPPKADGEAATALRVAASGPEDAAEGSTGATGNGGFQKGCGNPVVQV